ncbi:MAG TPA: hypothetical protein VGG48_00940 [Rhizomicrobium sp.]|jgi:hypothetical protein
MTKQPKPAKINARRRKEGRAKTACNRSRGKEASRKVVERFEWQGTAVSVSYEADWLGMATEFPEFAKAHLEIEAVSPKRAKLPITDTGYRSHFLARASVEQAGGPVAYVRAWLDHAAKAPAWKRQRENERQLRLF